MPKRTHSHRLEDQSIQAFERCLPEHWVCRRKDKDYGVDLEVEIFDETEEATGLMFIVQVKGTGDPSKAGSLSMKIDRLDYLMKLDSPSIIVRYYSGTDACRWMWVTNVCAQIGSPTTASATIHFAEDSAWSAGDPQRMIRTLRTYRMLREAPRRLPIGLTIAPGEQAHPATFEFRAAVAQIVDGSRTVTGSSDPADCFPVTVQLDEEYLRVEIDVIASIGVHLRSFDRAEIAAQLVYALARIAAGYEFIAQARDLAALIVARGHICQSRELAADLAARLVEFPDLASLNELAARQDPAYAIYTRALLEGALPLEDRARAISAFYTEALKAQAPDPVVQSTIHYSYGNALRIAGDMLGALRQYNLARKANPDYWSRGYFVKELAATCYFASRHDMAARLYELAHAIEPTPQSAICAGDAHFFRGDVESARRRFEEASLSEDRFESAESFLKLGLADWAACSPSGQSDPGSRSATATLAHWNDVLVEALREERPDDALSACLMLCYLSGETVGLWAQALLIAPFVGNGSLVMPVLTCAIGVHGYDAYSQFRDESVARINNAEMFVEIDRMAAELFELRRRSGERGMTTRLIGEYHWDALVELPPSD